MTGREGNLCCVETGKTRSECSLSSVFGFKSSQSSIIELIYQSERPSFVRLCAYKLSSENYVIPSYDGLLSR